MLGRISFKVLILILLSASSVATAAISGQKQTLRVAASSGISQASYASAELNAAIAAMHSTESPLHNVPVSCSLQGGSGACELAQGVSPATSSSSGFWTIMGSSPDSRGLSAMAYDAADGYVVLFGGLGIGSGVVNKGDTWKFQAGTWTNITPNVSPPARAGASMVYDTSDGYLVLFGGIRVSSTASGLNGDLLHDTWTFVGGAWTNATTAQSPSARAASSMTYDAASSSVILFGGATSVMPPGPSSDTWKFTSGLWTNITSTLTGNPGARIGAGLAYDAADNYDVLFGGNSTSGVLHDTWKLSGTSWSNLVTSSSPPARFLTSMAYDASDSYVLLFGGETSTGVLGDTWEFHAGAWENITSTVGPFAVQGSSTAFDASDGYVLLFGGVSGHSLFETTWKFHGGSWANITPPNPAPPGRLDASLVYDAADGYVVLFGGLNVSPLTTLSDTWEFSHGTWANITKSGPSPRYDAAMAYDAADGYVLLYGGFGIQASGYHFPTDTWKFSAGSWTNITTTAGPGPGVRLGPSMAFDAADNYIVLFGGAVLGSFASDTWRFSGGMWSGVAASGLGPSGRYNGAMTFDVADNYVVLFGGNSTTTASIADTWKYASGVWTNITPVTSPSARDFSVMTYDAADGFVLLFGGQTGSSQIASDTWKFVGGIWTNITSPGPFGAFPSMTYDTGGGYVVLVSLGFSGLGFQTQTWKFSTGAPPFNFTLSGPSGVSVAQGTATASLATQIVATLTSGSPSLVAFSVVSTLPSGVTATIGSLSPPLGNNQCRPTCTMDIGFTASLTAAIGTYTVDVQASGGGVTRSVSFSLTVEIAFTYSLSTPSPDSLTVVQGSTSGSSSITATLLTGSSSRPLGFIVTSNTLPAGITPNFNPGQCYATCTVTVAFTAASTAPIGIYSLKILALDGGSERTQLTLTVVAPSISTLSCGHGESCSVLSNATQLSNFNLAGNTLHVEADGPHGAHGYLNVTIPRSEVPSIEQLHVFVDSNKLDASSVTITSNSTAYFVYFTFTFHSPVKIDIQFASPLQTPSPTIFGIDQTVFYVMMGAAVAIVVIASAVLLVRRRGRSKPQLQTGPTSL